MGTYDPFFSSRPAKAMAISCGNVRRVVFCSVAVRELTIHLDAEVDLVFRRMRVAVTAELDSGAMIGTKGNGTSASLIPTRLQRY